MPPIRWQFLTVLAIFLINLLVNVSANHHNLPLTSNGWRPIVGDRYEKRGQIIPESSNLAPQVIENNSQNIRSKNGPQINQQRLPDQSQIPKKSINSQQQFSASHPQENGLKPPSNQNLPEKNTNQNGRGNVKETVKGQGSHGNFLKNSNPGKIRVNHHGSTGHHSKHAMLSKPPQKPVHKPVSQMHMSKGPVRHSSNLNKGPGPNQGSSKRPNKSKQPYRTQATAHSQKEEIIAPAPSSGIGSYTYFNQGPFNIRDTQLGDRTKTGFHPQDFRNHFPTIQGSNSEIIPHVHHNFGFGKHPSQNELHNANFNQFYNQNDEYTRNLVPPPPAKPEIVKESVEKQNVAQNSKQFFLKPKDNVRDGFPESIGFPQKFNYEVRPLDLEITREKIREYHTTAAPVVFSKGTTEAYSTIKFTNKPINFNHGYEVTEDKRWQESSPFYQFSRPTTPVRLQTYPTILPNYQETTQFLPTPFIETFPTINPQEVSTVYSEVAKYNRQNYQPNHNQYNIKEVATHFPIFEIKSPILQNIKPIQNTQNVVHSIEEIPQKVIPDNSHVTEEYTPATEEPIRPPKPTRTRPNLRRRRPTRPTTTEAPVEPSTEATVEVSSERNVLRRRRPMKPRPSEGNEDTRGVRRRPASRPSVEEEPENYPPNFPSVSQNVQQQNLQNEEPTENYPRVRTQETRKYENQESVNSYRVEVEPTTTEYPRPTALQYSEEPAEEFETTTVKRRRIKTTTEAFTQQTSFKFPPENELDYTTTPYYSREVFTEEPTEPSTILTTTSSTTTTTTTEAPTVPTKSHRIRRPSKYDNLRPRFSVKDYKQKFNTLSSTTESNKVTSPSTIGRIKYPSRFTKEPNSKEDETEMLRFRFKPKDARYRSTTEAMTEPTTEKYKPTRIRPFGRIRTTEATTTSAPKVSIKPNIFSNLKRPQTPGLRTRILNKNKTLTTTEAPTTEEPEPSVEESVEEISEVTLPIQENHMESTTETFRRILDNTSPDYEDENEGEKSPDEAEAFLHLQRITELTSQAKNNHFKTMSTASRRVPSYFTISTDDPILPIEAFFSKINQDN